MDSTLKLQIVFKITVMGLSFSVKLALNFKYFERLWYFHYKTEIWKICCNFFLVKLISNKKLNFFMIFKIHFMYFCRGFFLSTLGPKEGRSPTTPPAWLRAWGANAPAAPVYALANRYTIRNENYISSLYWTDFRPF